ncbi:MAG: AI-2E family transporter [Patescibacteria group bacterium]
MQKLILDFRIASLLKIVLVAGGVYLVWRAWEVIAIIFIALFLSALIQPAADYFAKYKIPRGLTVIGVYLAIFGLLALIVTLMVPTIIEQSIKLGGIFGQRWDAIADAASDIRGFADKYQLMGDSGFASIQNQASAALSRLFQTLTGVFGGIVGFIIVLVMTFYLVSQEDKAKILIHDWVSNKHKKFALHLVDRLQEQLGRWFRGQLVLSFIIGLLSYIGLKIIGIEGALVLAIFAGLLEFIPYLGPILSGIPIVFVAFTQSPLHGLLALAMLVVIQQGENHLIVPKVMEKAVGLNPLISIISMLVGARLFGLLGALMAIPLATAIMVIVKETRNYKNS